MNGMGIFTWTDGKRYIGEYLNGKKSGFGILTSNDRSFYGMWHKGKQHGLGYIKK